MKMIKRLILILLIVPLVYAETTFYEDNNFIMGSSQEVPSSSGGGGGGGGLISCDAYWICDEWSTCNNGIQTRVCIDLNQCYYVSMPITEIECSQDLSDNEISICEGEDCTPISQLQLEEIETVEEKYEKVKDEAEAKDFIITEEEFEQIKNAVHSDETAPELPGWIILLIISGILYSWNKRRK